MQKLRESIVNLMSSGKKVTNGLGQLNFRETEQCVQRSVCFTACSKYIFFVPGGVLESCEDNGLTQITHFLSDSNCSSHL